MKTELYLWAWTLKTDTWKHRSPKQCSAKFSHLRHTRICQKHMKKHHKMAPSSRLYKPVLGHKYVSAYKRLPYDKTAYETKHNTHWTKRSMINVCVCVCVCVCVLRILITKNKILLFSNHSAQICNFIQKFAAKLKPCAGTSVAVRWSKAVTIIKILFWCNFRGHLPSCINLKNKENLRTRRKALLSSSGET
jgi:hypothetical protein